MANCKVCHKEFLTEANLHKHVKVHKIYLADYYQTYFPRYDKYSHELINFRNKNQYSFADFNSRENLHKWMNTTNKSIVRAYAKMLLEQRRDRKKLVWAPCQVELRTIMLPPIQAYNDLFGDYYALCEELGLKVRFQTHGVIEDGCGPDHKPPIYTIYIDTREQKPFDFYYHSSEFRGLKYGDYICSDNWNTCQLAIERKSPQDFCGTFSGGMARFSRELDRAKTAGAYIVVLVEDTLNRMLKFNHQPYIYHKNTRIHPDFVFHNVRDIIQSYENIQFLFVENHVVAENIVIKLFDSGCSYQKIDLQLQYDLRQL